MEKSYEQQMAWLSLAESRAQNPEFKELWVQKQKELEKKHIKETVMEILA